MQNDQLLSISSKNELLSEQLNEVKRNLSQFITIDNHSVPEFGVLTLKMQVTPVFLFDHPALLEKSKTAFSDGSHVFVSADFFNDLNEEVVKTNGKSSGIIPVILGELMKSLVQPTEINYNEFAEEAFGLQSVDLVKALKKKDTGEWSNRHDVSIQEVQQFFKENNLNSVLRDLDLISDADVQKREEIVKIHNKEIIEKAESYAQKVSNFPGAEVLQSAIKKAAPKKASPKI